jgi:protein phosphatase 1 regulatory subunit 7
MEDSNKNDDGEKGQDTTTTATTTTTPSSNTVKTATVDSSTLPLDWTKLGQADHGDDEKELPVRYPHDVMEWSAEDDEIYNVGTAGQKITILGDDFADPATTNFDLQTLVLRSHLIKDMAGLGHFKQLRLLELYDNMVQSLADDTMRGCGPSLTTLDMSYNAIRDMTPVSYCSNLTELYLANNKLKEIKGLSSLATLKKLDLGANRIRVMDPNELGGLVNLEELWIGKNKIEEINGLEKVRGCVCIFASVSPRAVR